MKTCANNCERTSDIFNNSTTKPQLAVMKSEKCQPGESKPIAFTLGTLGYYKFQTRSD